ncbi:MAG TPA: DUF1538 domain-containing protein [Firmicutes bacterium]|nr:DUF1538 domain-containing protein [Bacillota bacterium]
MQKIKETFREVVFAMLPVVLVVTILQFTLLHLPGEVLWRFFGGAVMVGGGLFLFLLGVQIGMLPMGETIGSAVAQQGKLWLLLLFGFILGFIITVAEPDVRVLAMQVDLVSGGAISRSVLVYTIALGVGIFVALAMLRTIFNIPLAYLLIPGYALIFAIAAFAPPRFIPVSFDAGGVTTGPMAVPFILALGVGVTAVLGGKRTTADRFGLVALASIGPVLAVLLLGVIYR